MKSLIVFLLSFLIVNLAIAQNATFLSPVTAPSPNPVLIGGTSTGSVTLRVMATVEDIIPMGIATGNSGYVISSASIVSGPSISSFDQFDLSDPTSVYAYNNSPLTPGDYVFTYTVTPTGTVPDPIGTLVAFQFGGAAVQASSNLVLPVKLVSFDVKKEADLVTLTWSTTEEINSDYFEIQRSSNAKDWLTLGTVKSRNSGVQENDYSYTVSQLRNGRHYFRLKMVDLDGTAAMSQIRNLSLQSMREDFFSFGPNPAFDYVTINAKDLAEINSVSIMDKSGRSVFSSASITDGKIGVQNLTDGLYVLQVSLKNGESATRKIMISR